MCRATASPRHASTSSSSVPCTTRPGHVIRAGVLRRRLAVDHLVSSRAKLRSSVSASVSSAQPTASSICFVECGSVKHLAEEELGVPAPVAQPVVAVLLGPALVGVEHVVERVRDRLRHASPSWTAGAISISAATRSGCSAARMQATRPGRTTPRPPRGRRPAASSTATASSAYSRRRTPSALRRPVRAAVAARVERDDGAVPGEVRDLALPRARVHDLPGRKEQERRLSAAVALPVDPRRRRARRTRPRPGTGPGSARRRPSCGHPRRRVTRRSRG